MMGLDWTSGGAYGDPKGQKSKKGHKMGRALKMGLSTKGGDITSMDPGLPILKRAARGKVSTGGSLTKMIIG